jgi:hypothetical protein
MSLVLEALKKLDREKGRDERGFVVMAAAPWPTRVARRWPAWAALGLAVAGGVVALLAVRAQRTPAPVTATSSAPAAAASIAAVPAPATGIGRSSAAEAPRRIAPRAATSGPAAPAASPAPHAVLRLQAVSERDGQPIAIVNDRLVRVGDEVEGMRVLAIRATEVDVEIKGHRTTLRF